jgi:predicted phage baseplate assembly protein
VPLETETPRLDDRRYDELIKELRTRVPRYAPEWTDLNDNDPGVALLQLFAWTADQLLYRIGRVPELNFVKFLELLGVELLPAAPATAEITLPLRDSLRSPALIVPQRARVSAEAEDGGQVVFETERALLAVRARLSDVQAFTGDGYRQLSVENSEEGFLPFGEAASLGTALLLGFETAVPLPPSAELDLAFFAVEQPGPAAFACDLPATAFTPPATLAWEYWGGREWARLGLVRDDTRALTRSGHVLLRLPPAGFLQPTQIGRIAENRIWLRARIERGGYERPPRLFSVRTNTVPTIQAETRRDEVLGGSDGSPDQAFRISDTPVLAGTLRLEVDEGDGFTQWTEVADLLASGADDRHFTLDRTTGTVRFGEGERGRIPVANPDNPTANVVARSYRFGGGLRGNVAAGALRTPITPIAGVDDARVGNLRAAVGGRDEEQLKEAKIRARRSLKSRCRAVTVDDFELLAQEAGNVRRAKALPLHHPDYPGVRVPGVVTVIIVPDIGERAEDIGKGPPRPPPMPSEGTLRTVCAYLNQRRLLTSEVYVARPTYREVSVAAEIVAAPDADLEAVRAGVERDLLRYFHPLFGGEQDDGWPFGGDIIYSRVTHRIFSQPGVVRVARLRITLDGEEAAECRDVPINPGELVFTSGHDLLVSYESEEE